MFMKRLFLLWVVSGFCATWFGSPPESLLVLLRPRSPGCLPLEHLGGMFVLYESHSCLLWILDVTLQLQSADLLDVPQPGEQAAAPPSQEQQVAELPRPLPVQRDPPSSPVACAQPYFLSGESSKSACVFTCAQ